MTTFTIDDDGRGYWIVAIADDGSRSRRERHDSENDAVRRLRIILQAEIATPERGQGRPCN